MNVHKHFRVSVATCVLLTGCCAALGQTWAPVPENKAGSKHGVVADGAYANAVIWRDPGNIAALDLAQGQGGVKHAPQAPFKFLEEDKAGTNPKFDVRDADGKKWRVKLGEEARPEVVASRLLWAVGYFVNDDYLLHDFDVPGLQLSRGDQKGSTRVSAARFARRPGGQDKVGVWQWKHNPFIGTREFNGLRVMMAVMNNWDLKDENNAVYTDKKNGRTLYLVSDVGATFATNDRRIKREVDKGNLDSYEQSKFITKIEAGKVSFATPAPPKDALLHSGGILVRDYFRRSHLEYIGQDIPVADAKWVGGLLGQLSHQQLMDAFRAGFDESTAIQFVSIVENRIAELKTLR